MISTQLLGENELGRLNGRLNELQSIYQKQLTKQHSKVSNSTVAGKDISWPATSAVICRLELLSKTRIDHRPADHSNVE